MEKKKEKKKKNLLLQSLVRPESNAIALDISRLWSGLTLQSGFFNLEKKKILEYH